MGDVRAYVVGNFLLEVQSVTGRLKWNDVVLKQGVTVLGPDDIWRLRKGDLVVAQGQSPVPAATVAQLLKLTGNRTPVTLTLTAQAGGRKSVLESVNVKYTFSSSGGSPGGGILEIRI